MRALVAQWEAKRHQLAVSVPAEQPSKQLWPAIAARTQPAAVRRPSAQTSWLRPAGFGLGGLAAGVLAASAVFFTASALFMTADEIAMRTGEKLPQSYVGLLTDAAGNGKAVAMLLDTFEKLLSKVSKLIVTVETDRPVPQARMCFSTVIAQNYGDSPIICIRSGCGNFCVLCRQVLLAVRLFNPTITEFNMKKITFKQMAALPLLCFALAGAVLAADTPSDTPVAQAIDEMAAGRQAVKDKKWTQAISSFKKAIAENPKNADAHNMLGYSHRAPGQV